MAAELTALERKTTPTSPLARLNRKTTGGRRPWRGEGSKESLRDRESLEVDARWKGRTMEVLEHRGRDGRAEAGVAGKGRGDPVAGVGDDASGPCPRWSIGKVKE